MAGAGGGRGRAGAGTWDGGGGDSGGPMAGVGGLGGLGGIGGVGGVLRNVLVSPERDLLRHVPARCNLVGLYFRRDAVVDVAEAEVPRGPVAPGMTPPPLVRHLVRQRIEGLDRGRVAQLMRESNCGGLLVGGPAAFRENGTVQRGVLALLDLFEGGCAGEGGGGSGGGGADGVGGGGRGGGGGAREGHVPFARVQPHWGISAKDMLEIYLRGLGSFRVKIH